MSEDWALSKVVCDLAACLNVDTIIALLALFRGGHELDVYEPIVVWMLSMSEIINAWPFL